MKNLTPFPNQDLKLITKQIIFALVSIILSISLYLGVDKLNTQAQRDLNSANSDYAKALQSVALIEEEEATIIEYIDRFQQLSEAGIVASEDRMRIYELIPTIRTNNNLFPISLKVNKQISLNLAYPPEETEPGQTINLNSSSIELSLPLLHEEDLTRLLSGITSSPGLYQTMDCDLKLQSPVDANFYTLAQHQTANCKLLWYTFDLNPPVVEETGYF